MGWIAVGTGTLVAAYAVYALVTRYADHDSRSKDAFRAREQQTLEKDQATNSPSLVVNGSIPEPPAVSAPEQTVEPSKITPTTSALMPPPPLPKSRTPSPPRLNPPTIGSMPPPPRIQPPLRSSSPPRLKPPSMAPPPRPGTGALRPPPSAASSLRVPQTKVLSNTHMQPASSTLPLPSGPSKKSRAVTLQPGYSPLDWAALAASPTANLRGKDAPPNGRLIRVTPSQLKKQNGRKGKDTWTSYQGRVYNVTPYLPFHPGGKGELMRGAGRDAGDLFMEVHPWVNWEGMLGECLVGILVAEGEGEEHKEDNDLDEMD